MRALMVFPDWGYFPLPYRRRLPVLGPIQAAACLPPDWEVAYWDARVEPEPPPMTGEPDLVLIACMTNQVASARVIARRYRERGVPVVAGGLHPTLLPEACGDFADAVVVGEAEDSLPRLAADLAAGRLQPLYTCHEFVPAERIPRPRRDLNRGKGHVALDFVQTARGCPLNCEFCNVPGVAGRSLRARALDDVLAELADCRTHIFFVDDNLMLARRRVGALLQAMTGLGRIWTGLAQVSLAGDRSFVELLARSGCWLLYLDMGPWLTAELAGFTEGTQVRRQVRQAIEVFHGAGIKLIGSFVFGYDHDRPPVFERTVEFALEAGLVEAEFLISTPYPHTRLFEKLAGEGRLLTTDWGLYTTTRAVYRPARMEPSELEDGWRQAWQLFYGDRCRLDSDGNPVVETDAVFPVLPPGSQDY